jgi:threonylcarbamoyladenosine tRNA methylthiotransferase MtaB
LSGVDVITFGCRLNTYESEVMRAEAEKAGLNNAILVNTCAVTGEAVRQARQAIRRARREKPAVPPRPKNRPLPACPRSTRCSATRKS